jgi:nickel-dependent lactate racemase
VTATRASGSGDDGAVVGCSGDDGAATCGLPCGGAELPLCVPRENLVGIVKPRQTPVVPESLDDELAIVRAALTQPIGAPPLHELAADAGSAAIVVSDVTRPCPTHRFLPLILAELESIPAERVAILFALGSHRVHTEEERRRLVGDSVVDRYRCLDLDESDCVPLGTTSRGTPLEVFRPYVEADLRICTGNLEYHYFAGYSGGAKAVMPGICARSAIQPNHSMMLEPAARAGILRGNPVREDIDEAGGLVGVDFIVNVLLDEKKRIVGAVAGHYLAAHAEGVRRYDELFDLRIDTAVDIVVASPGGSPKDINLYQAQKTLDNVAGAVRKGGTIVLVAQCAEGFGESTFAEWMADMENPRVLIERIQRQFVLGGHKAAAIANLLLEADVWLVSEFPPDTVREMGMRPFTDAQLALAAALEKHGDGARVLVVPYGSRVTVTQR